MLILIVGTIMAATAAREATTGAGSDMDVTGEHDVGIIISGTHA